MSTHDTTQPRITIITSTFNCAEALKTTAASLREQTYKNIQWIVADGASRDGTVDVIKANQDIVTDWFSEPDSGIYDAWNKACKLINGDWVFFLGAGDLFFEKNTLSKCAPILKNAPSDCKILYGDVHLIDKLGKKIGTYGKITKKWECNRPALPPHQGTFQKKSLFIDHPAFDSQLKIAADSKFLLRALKRTSLQHMNIVIAKMDAQGISSDPRNTLAALAEIKQICQSEKIKPPLNHTIKFYFLFLTKIILSKYLPKNIINLTIRLKRYIIGIR